VASPGGVVAVVERCGCSRFIGVVAGGEDCAGDAVEQLGRGLVALADAISYVTRAHQDRRVCRCRRRFLGGVIAEEE
jgi:hypothetical protein